MQGLIEDNYIHDLGYKAGDHVNGFTCNGGSTQLTIRHNTVFNQHSQTDAVSLFQDFGPQSNRLITNNLLAGGGYTLYAGANPGKESTATNIVVTNNRFSTKFYPRGGSYGPYTAYASGQGNVVVRQRLGRDRRHAVTASGLTRVWFCPVRQNRTLVQAVRGRQSVGTRADWFTPLGGQRPSSLGGRGDEVVFERCWADLVERVVASPALEEVLEP